MIIGYTTGVFDLFHIGHLNILRKAKEQCDYLIVGVSTDDNVISYKHKHPIYSFEDRCAIIRAYKYVDEIVPQENMDKFEAWTRLHFNIIFHGNDWKGSELYNEQEKRLNSVGVRTIYFQYTKGISSSQLSKKIME